jgi:co-chaperonin GroES (HSP10)
MTHHARKLSIKPHRTYIQVEVIGSLTSDIIDLSVVTAKEKPRRGRIIALGADCDHDAIKVGDIVSFSPQLNYPHVEFDWYDRRTRLIQQADIEFVEDDDVAV